MKALGCLLRKALNIVPKDTFEFRVLIKNDTNDLGNSIAEYTTWEKRIGSIQPGLTYSFNARGVSEFGTIMQQIGLDQSKKSITVFAPNLDKLRNVHDQDAPDQVRYRGKIYNIWSVSDWYEYDNWKYCFCVEDTRETERYGGEDE